MARGLPLFSTSRTPLLHARQLHAGAKHAFRVRTKARGGRVKVSLFCQKGRHPQEFIVHGLRTFVKALKRLNLALSREHEAQHQSPIEQKTKSTTELATCTRLMSKHSGTRAQPSCPSSLVYVQAHLSASISREHSSAASARSRRDSFSEAVFADERSAVRLFSTCQTTMPTPL